MFGIEKLGDVSTLDVRNWRRDDAFS